MPGMSAGHSVDLYMPGSPGHSPFSVPRRLLRMFIREIGISASDSGISSIPLENSLACERR
jgi:hypothetical protein